MQSREVRRETFVQSIRKIWTRSEAKTNPRLDIAPDRHANMSECLLCSSHPSVRLSARRHRVNRWFDLMHKLIHGNDHTAPHTHKMADQFGLVCLTSHIDFGACLSTEVIFPAAHPCQLITRLINLINGRVHMEREWNVTPIWSAVHALHQQVEPRVLEQVCSLVRPLVIDCASALVKLSYGQV